MITTLIPLLTPILDAAIGEIKSRLASSARPDYQINNLEFSSAIQEHLGYIERWSSTITFADSPGPRSLRDIFVNLDLSLTPRRRRLENETVRAISISNVSSTLNNIVILGDPGAGKTTSLKRICEENLQRAVERGTDRLPILVVLRDLGDGETLVQRVLTELGVVVTISASASAGHKQELLRRIFLDVARSVKLVLFIDGLDEVRDSIRNDVEADILSILQRSQHVQLFLTSRSADYRQDFPECKVYEIEPLTQHQVETLAFRWIRKEEEARAFVHELRASPFSDTAVRPLMLSHLCAIYIRTGKIPDKPKTVYKIAIRLLLQEWDEQKGIRRFSEYSKFEADRKQEFLEHLSFYLTSAFSATRFSHEQLQAAYGVLAANHGLPEGQAFSVAREIESHTGLLEQSGYERFEFAHKSLQEYLAAEYIVKYPALPEERSTLARMPNELAIAVALSSAPSEYLAQLIFSVFLKFETPGYGQPEPIDPDSGEQIGIFFHRLQIEKPNIAYSVRLGAAFLYLLDGYSDQFLVEASKVNSAPISEYPLREKDYALRALASITHFIECEAELLSSLRESGRYYDVVIHPENLVLAATKKRESEDQLIPAIFPKKAIIPLMFRDLWQLK